ncbi:hypothetical protein F1880_000593 [Penicillium rolfsii]|nr:hypothetical protein F1880_000593 [Penicillium rolfsii]
MNESRLTLQPAKTTMHPKSTIWGVPIVPITRDPVYPQSFCGSSGVLPKLAVLYFRFIHNVMNTIFHSASFMRRLSEGSAPKIVVFSICALSARYSHHQSLKPTPPSERGKIYADEAFRLLHPKLVMPSLETIQACLLLGQFLGGEGEYRTKHIYVGIARLHAEVIRLWEVPDDLPVVDREERRRTWLTVRISSQWSASDMGTGAIAVPYSQLSLPCVDDLSFHTGPASSLQESPGPTKLQYALWCQMAGTLEIFDKVASLLRRLSQSDDVSFTTYCSEAPLLAQQLRQWANNLPAILQYSMSNLQILSELGLGRTFLAMHIGYHHFYQMLYFPFLNASVASSSKQSAPETSFFRDGALECKNSANAVSEIVQIASNKKNCELLCHLYAHITVVSSCVHLHTLLLSEDTSELAMARERLLLNFRYLLILKAYWPAVDRSAHRLRVFQNLCLDAISNPFALDNWMARFLTEPTSIIAEREDSMFAIPSTGQPEIPTPSESTQEASGVAITTNTSDSSGEWSLSTVPGFDSDSSMFSSLLNNRDLSTEDLTTNLHEDQARSLAHRCSSHHFFHMDWLRRFLLSLHLVEVWSGQSIAKELRNLLKRFAAGLGQEEIVHQSCDKICRNEERVVLPSDVFEGYGRDLGQDDSRH